MPPRNTRKTRTPSSKMFCPTCCDWRTSDRRGCMLSIWFVYKIAIPGLLSLGCSYPHYYIFVNFVLLRKQAYPLRWMVVGLVLDGPVHDLPDLLYRLGLLYQLWGRPSHHQGAGHRPDPESKVSPRIWARHTPGQPSSPRKGIMPSG